MLIVQLHAVVELDVFTVMGHLPQQAGPAKARDRLGLGILVLLDHPGNLAVNERASANI